MKKLILLIYIASFSTSLFAQKWAWASEPQSPVSFLSDTWAGDHYVTVDRQGDVYSTGYFHGSISFGSYALSSHSTWNMYLAKYDSSGKVLWATAGKMPDTLSSAIANSVAVDAVGDVYVTGSFIDTVNFGVIRLTEQSGLTKPPGDTSLGDFYITKYDANGNVLWAQKALQASSACSGKGVSVAADAAGNAYVAGNYIDTLTFGTFKLTGTGRMFLAKYDANGNVLWAKQDAGISTGDSLTSVAIDAAGNAYITGVFKGTLNFGAFSNTTTASFGDVFLVKYDANGNVVWATSANGGLFGIFPFTGSSVAVDGADNIYVTGCFIKTMTFGAYSLNASPDNYGTYLVKYNSKGNVIWAESGGGNCLGYSLACDTLKRGGCYMVMSNSYNSTPNQTDKINFGADTFSLNTSGSATVLMRLDSAGHVSCGSILSEGDEDDGDAVGVDPSGRYVYMGGDLDDTTIFSKDTLVHGGDYAFIARWLTCGDTIQSNQLQQQKQPIDSLTSCVYYIPNAFSPNGDNHNDKEYVYSDCINTMDLNIYDRWGNKVFESTNIKYGWDGTYKGLAMNTGSFAYYLTATFQDGATINKKGNIALVR